MDTHFSDRCAIEINKNNNCNLTSQEARVLSLAAEGLGNKKIALKLSITEGTIKKHMNSVFSKLHLDEEEYDIRVKAVVIYKNVENELLSTKNPEKLESGGRIRGNNKDADIEKKRSFTTKNYVFQDIFWNPRFKPPGTALKHALAVKNISVLMCPLNELESAINVTFSARLVSQGWKSIGDDMAPFIHLDFLDELGIEIPIDYSKEWTVADFRYHEDRPINITKMVFTQQYSKVTGVRVWLSEGYAYPSSIREYDPVGLLVFPVMMGRAFIARLKRRIKRVFWVPKKKQLN
jgi:hypothetical protein